MTQNNSSITEQDLEKIEDKFLAHHIAMHSIMAVLIQTQNELYVPLLKQLTYATNYLQDNYPDLSGALPELDIIIQELMKLKPKDISAN